MRFNGEITGTYEGDPSALALKTTGAHGDVAIKGFGVSRNYSAGGLANQLIGQAATAQVTCDDAAGTALVVLPERQPHPHPFLTPESVEGPGAAPGRDPFRALRRAQGAQTLLVRERSLSLSKGLEEVGVPDCEDPFRAFDELRERPVPTNPPTGSA